MRLPTQASLPSAGHPRVRLPHRGGAEVRVSFSQYRVGHYLDLRVWYETPDGAWAPTRRGVPVPEEQVPNLLEVLGRAAAAVSGEGQQHWP